MFNFYLSFHEFEKADDSSLRRLLSIALYPVEEIPHFSDRDGVGGVVSVSTGQPWYSFLSFSERVMVMMTTMWLAAP